MSTLIVPAILPATSRELKERLALFAHFPSVARVQIDVVDGRLASPPSWPYTRGGPGEFAALQREGTLLPGSDSTEYEIDLMCLDALEAAGPWLAQGASRLTFHIESAMSAHEGALPAGGLFAAARAKYGGLSPLVSLGLALNVETDLDAAEPYIIEADYVQFMGIAKIGRQGERFDPRAEAQVRSFRTRHPHIDVQVDGGVTLEVAPRLLALGVSHLVVGSAILGAKDPAAALAAFEALESPYGV